MDVSTVKKLSLEEPKSILERTVKLQEEVGELAQEILIQGDVSGFQHKKPGQDGVMGECVDVILVALSIFFAQGGSVEQLDEIVAAKCEKWKKHRKV